MLLKFNSLEGSPDSPYKEKVDVFHLLNEALTEKFSREITDLYLEADQDFDRNLVRIYKETNSNKKKDHYIFFNEIRLFKSVRVFFI